jgi:hypothetical protein
MNIKMRESDPLKSVHRSGNTLAPPREAAMMSSKDNLGKTEELLTVQPLTRDPTFFARHFIA